MPGEIPDRFRGYDCADYFDGDWSESGYFDEPSQTLVIAPLAEAYENQELAFFVIGRSGVDGIDFGYRRGRPGLWAFYPIEIQFKFMARTVDELVRGWCDGKLSV